MAAKRTSKSLPRALEAWVSERVREGGFATRDAFITHVLLQAKRSEAWRREVERKVQESIDENVYFDVTPAMFDEIRAEGRRRAGASRVRKSA
jgi:Arc/MetJ-type ribon-helix-helix transcriptional regulator